MRRRKCKWIALCLCFIILIGIGTIGINYIKSWRSSDLIPFSEKIKLSIQNADLYHNTDEDANSICENATEFLKLVYNTKDYPYHPQNPESYSSGITDEELIEYQKEYLSNFTVTDVLITDIVYESNDTARIVAVIQVQGSDTILEDGTYMFSLRANMKKVTDEWKVTAFSRVYAVDTANYNIVRDDATGAIGFSPNIKEESTEASLTDITGRSMK